LKGNLRGGFSKKGGMVTREKSRKVAGGVRDGCLIRPPKDYAEKITHEWTIKKGKHLDHSGNVGGEKASCTIKMQLQR